MVGLIFRRVIQLPVILTVIFLITFTLAWVLPGSPLDREDKPLEADIERAIKARYNLDSPGAFLFKYVQRLMHGDLGPSLAYRDQTVNDIIGAGLPVSALIGLAALNLALILGVGAGIIGAMKPGSAWDLSSLGIALLGISLPTFVTGSVLLFVFAGMLGWFPISGWGTPGHLFLPALTLSLAPAAYIARLVRLGLADVMSSDYIRTARAKGLSPNRVLFDHALKVAFLPVLSFMGPAAAATMTQKRAWPNISSSTAIRVPNVSSSMVLLLLFAQARPRSMAL